jgi:hypothetical protein
MVIIKEGRTKNERGRTEGGDHQEESWMRGEGRGEKREGGKA